MSFTSLIKVIAHCNDHLCIYLSDQNLLPWLYISGFHTGFFVREVGGGGGDFVMVGTLRGCPIEIMTLEIIELEMTNFDSMSGIFKTLYLALINYYFN